MARSYTLCAMEVSHIQKYIFNSNRLKENVGASYLVEAATDTWAREEIQKTTNSHNLRSYPPNDPFQPHSGKGNEFPWEAEVIYAGGGNFVALFHSSDTAKQFASRISGRIMLEAPGLHLVLNSMPFDPDSQVFSEAVQQVLKGLKAARSQYPPALGLGGLGVTALCHSTGMPAVTWHQYDEDDEASLYSAETVAKRAIFETANEKITGQVAVDHGRYSLPLDLDDMGRSKGDQSFIAVVHADGNNLGKIVGTIGKVFNHISDHRTYIQTMRAFSQNIKAATERALQETIALLQERCDEILQMPEADRPIDLCIDPTNRYRYILPFRPLITGGDDVNFICDGRLGLSLAAAFLAKFHEHATAMALQQLPPRVRAYRAPEQMPLPDTLTACAGIAIVKTHYPFARAYELAEALASSAKKMVRDRQKTDNTDQQFTALDWHIAMTGIYGELDDIREREYVILVKTKNKETGISDVIHWNLTMRPVYLKADEHEYCNWHTIELLTRHFKEDPAWASRRSKAKGLMQALRGRQTETKLFEIRYLKNVGLELPNPVGRNFSLFKEQAGWHEHTCGYYDALELMDLYVPLAVTAVTPITEVK